MGLKAASFLSDAEQGDVGQLVLVSFSVNARTAELIYGLVVFPCNNCSKNVQILRL